MAGVMALRSLQVLVVGMTVASCMGPRGPAAKKDGPAQAGPAKTGPGPLGRVREDVGLPLTAVLGQPVAAVEARLGEHLGKGMARGSCVRFVPERVFFACDYALQRYADPTGTWTGVRVEYEDGIATGVGFDGWVHGSGEIDPSRLLAAAGLELPEPPRTDSPAEGVQRWAWFNNDARLQIAGKQHRVEISAVGGRWDRSRVDVQVNDPLTAAQTAKILRSDAAK